MFDITSTFNLLSASFIVVLQIAIVLVVVVFLITRNKSQSAFLTFISRHAYLLAFLIAFFATLGSLVYSNIIGYAPCDLCWYERILLYPQVLLLGMALWNKDRGITDYILALSGIGLLFSIYHKYVELGGHSLLCGTSSVSCAKIYVNEFGYITIPVMALTTFLAIHVLMHVRRKVG